MNKIIVSGNIVRDIELKQTQSGNFVISNCVAVARERKEANGEYITDFFNFVAWNKQAEYLNKTAKKGDRTEICGRLQNRTYTDNKGDERTISEIIVESIRTFAKAEETQTQATNNERVIEEPSELEDDELPF